MAYDYDWCSHTPAGGPAATPRPCGAPIERWSREWKHRDRELEADHPAKPYEPVGPLEEGLHLRADRYATALATAAAADERIKALTDLLRMHEFYREQAESTLAMVQEDEQFGTVWAGTGPEPEDVSALLCLTTGHVYRRRLMHWGGPTGWRRAEQDQINATTYEWPIDSAGPFIAWRDAYGFDQVLRHAADLEREFDALHRNLYGEKGYRDEQGGFARPRLAEAVERIHRAYMERTYAANTKAQAVGQQLGQLRRLLGYLEPDCDGTVDLDTVLALLTRPDCGGQ